MAHTTAHPGYGGDYAERAPALGAVSYGEQAFWILRVGFTVAPLVAGIDKFFHYLVDWNMYLAPWVTDTFHIDAQTCMRAVGVTEIVAGIGVALFPQVFAYVVAAWLLGI